MQAYVVPRVFRHMAMCDCGFQGARRWSRSTAAFDAAMHDIDAKHSLTVPLSLLPLPAWDNVLAS